MSEHEELSQQDLTLSRGDLAALRELLVLQRCRRLDVVVAPEDIGYESGKLRLITGEQAITEDGVTAVDGLYHPTRTFEAQLAWKIGIRGKVVQQWRSENRRELITFTINHYLHGSSDIPQTNPPYTGKLLLRLFTGDETGGGIARACLSDRFRVVDNLDVLVQALRGIEAAGVPVDIRRCDLTEQRMHVQVAAPGVQVMAPELLRNYRSPYTGKLADENPAVFAGFVLRNSEVGEGAVAVVPRITVQACTNGMTFTADSLRAVHVGVRQQEGVVRYAADTVEKELELVRLRVRDAVWAFLTEDYVAGKVRELEQAAGTRITKPEETVKKVVMETGIPQSLADDVLSRFIEGAQLTAGGVAQAITSVARELPDADLSYELEDKAAGVVVTAARLA